MELQDVIAHVLTDVDRYESHQLANREDYIERGFRLISHDQDGRDLLLYDGLDGRLLFRGTLEESNQFFEDSERPLAVLDTIDAEIGFDDTPIPGLPESLVQTLRDWVDNNLEEARDLAQQK